MSFRVPRMLVGGCILITAALLMVSTAVALAAAGPAIAEGFKTAETNLAIGALVSIRKGTLDTVELTSTKQADRLVGVLTDNPAIYLSDKTSSVKVVTEGVSSALVSDINGDIKSGDYITVSPIRGIGMKATSNSPSLGVAQADLSSVRTSTRTATGLDGRVRTVGIAALPVRIGIGTYTPDQPASPVPSVVQRIAEQVAGKPVTTARILAASLMLFLIFMTVAVLLYGAVRSSIISIGRNPLSETALRKSLLQVGLTTAAIAFGGLVSTYLILRI